MSRYGRPRGDQHVALLAVLLLSTRCWAADFSAAGHEMLQDAALHDVVFVDPDRGWAVGDRGVIWQTEDGGRHWHLQHSGVDCSLVSVCFIDGENGWAGGGWTHPYTHKTSGVILRTHDGGRRWLREPAATLPALRRIKFFDSDHGWALGSASAMYPSGVFRTSDGGRSWSPVPSGHSRGWLAGDFRDRRSGAVAGWDGSLAFVRQSDLRPSRTPSLGLRHLWQLRLTEPTGGWLVGDGGLALTTSDGGLTWQASPGAFPYDAAAQFDFRALAVYGSHCWIAGAPGTAIFYSPDGGHRWETFLTDQALPIYGLAFLDEDRGWAVGALGTILATRDGGRTWRRQRSGGSRAALLGLYSEPDKAPLELFSRLSASEGYLSAVELLSRRDVEVALPEESHPVQRSREALLALGTSDVAAAWRFPLRQAGLRISPQQIVAEWDSANDGRGPWRLEEHVVGKIRQWRPEVIVTEQASPQGDQPLSHVINQIVLAAVEKAADGTAYPEQITVANLQPWHVPKVFATIAGEQQGTVNLITAQLAPQLGCSLADHAATGRGLLAGQYQVPPQTIGFQLLVDHLPQGTGRRDFFSGINLTAGGDARRLLAAPAANNLDELRRMAYKQRNMTQLLARSDADPQQGAAWLGQIGDLTQGIPRGSAGELLYQLALRYHQSGNGELAADVLSLLVERYADHPLCEPALVWLIHYYASSEAAWRVQRATRHSFVNVAAGAPIGPASATEPIDGSPGRSDDKRAEAKPLQGVVHLGGQSTTASTTAPLDRAERAAQLGKVVESTRPALFAEPSVRFSLASARRMQGLPRDAERFYHALSSAPSQDAWVACAQSELWLMHGSQVPPKPIYNCIMAPAKPCLNGQLDDEVWETAKRIELRGTRRDDDSWPAHAMLAYDSEFLYVAASCRKAARVMYSTTNNPRPRDPDLSDRDRLDLLIDLDRDYSTYYRLTVDYRGWTGEACFGDATWNPQWFVAAAQSAELWTIEAAIPLSQLGSKPPKSRDVWAVGIQRTAPGAGFQSWTQPAAVHPRPEGFGLLIFE